MAADPVMWYYTDKEGKIHGPHNSCEMYQWFRMGYFPMDVLVKRERDPTFVTLGDMFKMYNGQVPFLVSQPTRPQVIHPIPVVPIPVSACGGIPFPPPSTDPSNPSTPVPVMVGPPDGRSTPGAFFAPYPHPYSIASQSTINSGTSTPNVQMGDPAVVACGARMSEYGTARGRDIGSLTLGNSPMPTDLENASSPSPSPPAYPPAPDSDGCASEAASTDGILRMVHAQRAMLAGGKERFFLPPEFAHSMLSVRSDGALISSDRMSLEVMEKHLEANRDWYDKQWMQIQAAKAKLPSKSDKQTETERDLFPEPTKADSSTQIHRNVEDRGAGTDEPIQISASAICKMLSEELGQKVVITD